MKDILPFSTELFPRAIVHLDADGFFAACEIAKNPSLRGMPVIVGEDRGIALALTHEAKKLGLKRGMRIHEIKRIAPQAIILPSDFENYTLMSGRMQHIAERFSAIVENYSIDECFIEITGLDVMLNKSYEEITREIKQTLQRELGITFSVGLAPTKVLAKVASRWEKPNGLTFIPAREAHAFLKTLPIENIWGIGRQTSAYLQSKGIDTALQFTQTDYNWVKKELSKPYQEIWNELRTTSVLAVQNKTTPQQSIMRTRTFTPTGDQKTVFAELIKNCEIACMRARQHGLTATKASFFLKKQSFRFIRGECTFIHPINTPEEMLGLMLPYAEQIWENTYYRATGITLQGLTPLSNKQLDLFDITHKNDRWENIHRVIDQINKLHDAPMVHLLGSTHVYNDRKKKVATNTLRLPFAGEIS